MLKVNLSLLLIFFFLLSFSACGSSPSSGGSAKPAWVDNLNSVFSRTLYVAAVGQASNRQMAERNALANLSGYFGQSIQADQTVRNSYYEAARSGAMTEWIDTTEIMDVVRTSSSIDTLIGAEIREIWFDAAGNTYYAAAVMDRQRTIRLYSDMISANLEIIKNLTNTSQIERNTLEYVSRYQFAGTVADINTDYVNILNVLGAPVPIGVTTGDQYRLEALNVIRVIPVSITVTGDRSGRVQSAFAKVFSELGFRTTGAGDPRYILNANVILSNPEYPGSPYQWVQMELSANLTDTAQGAVVVLPYNFTTREGHTTAVLAENRVFLSAEQKIESEYKELLSSYLNQLLPGR